MNTDVIGFLEYPFKTIGNLNAQFFRVGRRSKRVIAQYLHIESFGHLSNCHPDPAKAYKPKHLAIELVTHVFLSVPDTAF